MDMEMRVHKNIQSPWMGMASQNNPNLWMSKKLETSCLKGESHGQK